MKPRLNSTISGPIRAVPFIASLFLAVGAGSCAIKYNGADSSHTRSVTAPPATAATTNAPPAPQAAKNYYTCGMHPQIRSQDPDGVCPICHMPLLPADEVSGGAAGQ